ncbi:MAG: serine--tRNA ligase [Myxococcota bacterium]
MIDPNRIAEDPDLVKAHLRRRQADDAVLADIDRIVEATHKRRGLVAERDDLRARRNALSKEIGQLFKTGKGDEAEAKKAEVQAGNDRIAAIEAQLGTIEAERETLCLGIPNLLDDAVPDGKGEEDNVEVRRWGTVPDQADGESHVEIGTRLGILDLERAAKLSGARFWVLKGPGAKLERALVNFFLDLHTEKHGYTELMVPYLVQDQALVGTGQLPKFGAEMFKLAEPLNGSEGYLIPTAEVPVTNLHREEIVAGESLPYKYTAFTPCFRSEAGSAGRDVRGLIRVHQFHKVELVWVTTPERAAEDHQTLVSDAESGLQALELPYRVMDLCAGDISFGAARCFDLEVWLPSQGFREISSCSHFGDFQARRMSLRYRPVTDGKKAKPKFAHTLNGSGLAVGRTLVAILENYVQADGSLRIPKVLVPYLGGLEVIEPTSGS